MKQILLSSLWLFGLVSCHSEYRSAMVLGDSIAFGTGTSAARFNLASCLGEKRGVFFENKGIPGETTRGLLQRLSEVISYKPRYVILSIGGNDLQQDMAAKLSISKKDQRFPAEETLQNLQVIFSRFQDENISVYYINMSPPLVNESSARGLKSYAAALDGRLNRIEALAASYSNVKFLKNAMDGLWLDSQKMTDDIHPNDRGYAEMCQRVFERLED